MSWDCPKEDKGFCRRAGGVCQPGKKKCILKDKVEFVFIDADKEKNDK